MTGVGSINDLKLELCRILLKTGALKFGVFKLTSGKLSPYYVDLRIVPSFPKALKRIIGFYELLAAEELKGKFDKIVGIPTSGIPFAAILAYEMDKPFIYLRKERKTHGMEKRIEGLLYPGESVLIVDDLITTGKSIIEAVEAIRAEGGEAADALVLIDREEGGERSLKDMGVELHAFMKIREAAENLYDMEAITREQYEEILRSVG
ncbi:MAG: orotate phosphoribosyltransferase [Candidatus Bathyarchaeia archaeon]